MYTNPEHLWLSVGGPTFAPDDVMGTRSKQELVKDEVAFSAGIDPMRAILAASKMMLVAVDKPVPASLPSDNEQGTSHARLLSSDQRPTGAVTSLLG
ncbi:TPA: hypothetical protein QDB21_004319 [Burkholderia vietnamiensis]|nr:hypothetical protein [Burkholderia vietnamiensis]